MIFLIGLLTLGAECRRCCDRFRFADTSKKAQLAVYQDPVFRDQFREELKNRMSPQQAISAGYDRAFVTIMDANITTLLVAVILYAVGTGPVKGFAVTLSLGILTSMFTAIMGSRAIVNLVYGGRKVEKLSI